MSGQSAMRQLEPFAGGDGRIRYFVSALNPDFTSPVPTPGTHMEAVMNCSNYENSNCDNQVSEEFTDFIVRLAHFHHLLENKDQQATKIIIDKVYAIWQQLDDRAKAFYREFLVLNKTEAEKTSIVDERDYNTVKAQNGLTTYSVSLRKKPSNKDYVFEDAIPIMPKHLANFKSEDDAIVDHIDDDYRRKIFSGGGARDLKMLYSNIVKTSTILFTGLPDSHTKFVGFKIDEYIRKKLFRLKSDADVQPTDPVGTEYLDVVTKNVWKRNAAGKLETTVNGNVLALDTAKPDDLKRLITNNFACYGSGLSADKAQCEELMDKCILSEDPAKLNECIKFLNNGDYYTAIKEQVKNLNPIVAIRLLQKLGFKKVRGIDEVASREVIKVQDVGSWLKQTLSLTDVKDVHGNAKLLDYLRYVVAFVNSNPSILNKDYNGATAESKGDIQLSEYATKLSLSRRPADRTGASVVSLARGLDMLEANIKANLQGASRRSIGYTTRLPYGNAMASQYGVVVGQVGGGSMLPSDRAGSVINNVYTELMRRLANKGKELASADKEKIKNKLAQLSALEKELVTHVRYIELFDELLELGGEYESKIVTVAALKETVNNYARLSQKHGREELTILNIMKALDLISRGVKTSDATEVKPEGNVGVNDVL